MPGPLAQASGRARHRLTPDKGPRQDQRRVPEPARVPSETAGLDTSYKVKLDEHQHGLDLAPLCNSHHYDYAHLW